MASASTSASGGGNDNDNDTRTYYQILGIQESATPEEIRAAYKKMAIRWHPDKNQNNQEEAHRMMQKINEAYEVLSDADKKYAYDHPSIGGLSGATSRKDGGNLIVPFTFNNTSSTLTVQNVFLQWASKIWLAPGDFYKYAKNSIAHMETEKHGGVTGKPPNPEKMLILLDCKPYYLPYWLVNIVISVRYTADVFFRAQVPQQPTMIALRSETKSGELVTGLQDMLFFGASDHPDFQEHLQYIQEHEGKGMVVGWQTDRAVSDDDSHSLKDDVPGCTVIEHTAEAEAHFRISLARFINFQLSRRLQGACMEKLVQENPGILDLRNLSMQIEVKESAISRILLPAFICSYMYKRKIFNIVVNGQTEQISGDRPLSVGKAVGAGALGIGAIALIGGVALVGLGVNAIKNKFSKSRSSDNAATPTTNDQNAPTDTTTTTNANTSDSNSRDH